MADAVQKPDVNSRVVVWVGVAIVATILLAALVSWLMWHAWNPANPDNGPNAPFDFRVEGALLESAPRPALNAFLKEKEQGLNSWGWIDRPAGIAHIPIEQAMQLAAQRDAAGKERKR